MNVLFVTYDFPFPANTGGKKRAFHLLEYGAKHATITLFSFVREDFNADYKDEILKLGVKEVKVYKRKKLKQIGNIVKTVVNNSSIFKTLYFEKKVLEKLLAIIHEESIDIVHFESAYTAYYITNELKKRGIKVVLGTENIEHQLYVDYAAQTKNVLLKPFIKQQAGKLRQEEIDMMKNADLITAITAEEKEVIESHTTKPCIIVANGIDVERYPFHFEKKVRNNILFVGNFTYFPNVDAMNFFYNEVFVKLRDQMTLTIVGKQGRETLGFNDEKVICKDFVEDLVEEYRAADLMVFPVRIGGGTNFKVLEALSLGVPIVAYPKRLEGLGADAGKHFIEAQEPIEFFEKVNELLSDSDLRRKIATNGRTLVEDKYTWNNIGKSLLSGWKKLYAKS